MPTPVLPDPTASARTALLAQPSLTALVSTRIYYAVPATVGGVAATYPLLVLSLVDDDELRPETLAARVQVDVWGRGISAQDVLDAKAIAATVRSVARDLKGHAGISNSVAGLIVPNPDPTAGRARFIVDLLLEVSN